MRYRNWLILIFFLMGMLWIHQYIFLYADDLYYSRDAQHGWDYFPVAMLDELNLNGRVWVGTAMLLVLKPQIELFRLLNPLILTLTVVISAKITTFKESQINIKQDKPLFWLALLYASLFFFFLPLKIAHTTIYYAACAFNYLYPTTLALLYAYLLYTSGKTSILSRPEKDPTHMLRMKRYFSLCHAERLAKYLRTPALLLLAFFVGSSTQQVGMIGIGFTVMISFYLAYVRKKVPFKTFIPYYLLMFSGYGIVTYGSFKRLLWEQTTGNEVILREVVTALLKTNVFSQPAAPFVLLISLSSIFWLHYFSRPYSIPSFDSLPAAAFFSSKGNSNSASSDSDFIPSIELTPQPSSDIASPDENFSSSQRYTKSLILNRFLGILHSLALVGYVYLLLIREPVELTSENLLSLYGLCVIAFTLVYLFSLVYIAALILKKSGYPFLLLNSINAIGAQIMLIAVDARFASTYKVMFPSLLLLSIYILYSFLAFHKNVLFLSLAFFLIALSVENEFLTAITLLGLTLILVLYLIQKVRYPQKSANLFLSCFTALFIFLSFGVFSANLYGYYRASIPQNYNLQVIKEYHERGKAGELVLKKVTPSYYGYNLGNWITMPYFLKQCYGIKEDTPIRYID